MDWAEMMEKRVIDYIHSNQGECFGGWGWVCLPVSFLPGNIPPYLIKSMIERGLLIEGRHGGVLGIIGEVDDNGAQTGHTISRAAGDTEARR